MIMRTTDYTDTDLKAATFDNKANSRKVTIESDLMMFINEFADVTRGDNSVRLTVIPLDYKEYARLMTKPYKRPL
jgi:hypothetical protein